MPSKENSSVVLIVVEVDRDFVSMIMVTTSCVKSKSMLGPTLEMEYWKVFLHSFSTCLLFRLSQKAKKQWRALKSGLTSQILV
jgi:hypothetical protein